MGLPAIQERSPLAQGLTVNIGEEAGRYRLRIWVLGAPVEDSWHDTPTQAVGALAKIVMTRLGEGGKAAAIAALLRGLS